MPAPGGQSPEARGPVFSTPEAATPQLPAVPERAPAAPTPETASGSLEAGNQNAGMPTPVQLPVPIQQVIPTSVASQQPQTGTNLQSTNPAVANDVHVIEKEWVDKAKKIVSETLDDPYMQNHNVSLLKADYMKKRYGKDIKVPEDNPPAKV